MTEVRNAILRRLGRRPPAGVASPGASSDDQYWFPARRNPWPWIGGGVAGVALIWAIVVWTTGGGGGGGLDVPTGSGVTTVVPAALSAAGGFTSRDLSACRGFKAASNDGATLFAQAQAPEVDDLAASGALTEDIMDGYIDGLDAVIEGFDDPRLTKLVSNLHASLLKQRDQARTDEAAGKEAWGPLYPVVKKELLAFGSAFEARCEKGGVIVDAVPERR